MVLQLTGVQPWIVANGVTQTIQGIVSADARATWSGEIISFQTFRQCLE
jgi:hypothetical protein